MMSTTTIPFIQYGNADQTLLFLHANGYPPACYRPFLSQLSRTYQIFAMIQRPLWQDASPDNVKDWVPFTEDLFRFLDENTSLAPFTVIGHSLGGIATLRAAIHQPKRFRSIILLDPVLLPPYFISFWNIALKFNFAHHIHPHITTTLKRRREFDDLDRVFKSYRRRSTFNYMDDDALRAYIEGIACQINNGHYQLCFSPEWEAQIYYASIWQDMDIWRNLNLLRVPALIIRGAQTDTFWRQTAKRVVDINPTIQVETVNNATHLVPLEQPQEVSKLITNFLHQTEKP